GQTAARCAPIRSPGWSSSNPRNVSETSPWGASGGAACSHGVAGHGPEAQSVEATRWSQDRQSDQSTSSTHRCQSCQVEGAVTGCPWSLPAITLPAPPDADPPC